MRFIYIYIIKKSFNYDHFNEAHKTHARTQTNTHLYNIQKIKRHALTNTDELSHIQIQTHTHPTHSPNWGLM